MFHKNISLFNLLVQALGDLGISDASGHWIPLSSTLRIWNPSIIDKQDLSPLIPSIIDTQDPGSFYHRHSGAGFPLSSALRPRIPSIIDTQGSDSLYHRHSGPRIPLSSTQGPDSLYHRHSGPGIPLSSTLTAEKQGHFWGTLGLTRPTRPPLPDHYGATTQLLLRHGCDAMTSAHITVIVTSHEYARKLSFDMFYTRVARHHLQ